MCLADVAAGTGGFVINGIDVGDVSGNYVSGAGDVNGDGRADLIVGAFLAESSPPVLDTGESYVVFGPAPCPADLDGSGDVGFSDLLAVITAWGPCLGCPEDLDEDDDVGFSDLLGVITAWGPCR